MENILDVIISQVASINQVVNTAFKLEQNLKNGLSP